MKRSLVRALMAVARWSMAMARGIDCCQVNEIQVTDAIRRLGPLSASQVAYAGYLDVTRDG